MILLDRYLAKQFSRNLLLVLAALVTVYLLVDFFERIDDFVEARKGIGLAAKYFLFKIPLIIEQLIPVIILLGGIIVLGLLNHHGEILALKAVGIHTFRITVPITAAAVIFTLVGLGLAEWIVGPTTAHTNKILFEEVRQEKPKGILRGSRFYYRNASGFYSFEKNEDGENRFDHFIFSSWDSSYNTSTFLTADSAVWQEGQWTFENCSIKQKSRDGLFTVSDCKEVDLSLTATPGDFFIPEYKINEYSLSELHALAESDNSTRGTEAGLKFLERISFITLGIPLLMLGLPLLLLAHQRWGRDLSLAIPLSCGLSFAAWGGWSVMQSFVKTSAINPYVGAWAVHIFIAGLGTFLILQQDR